MSAHTSGRSRWYCEDCSVILASDSQSACPDCCGYRVVVPTHCGFGFGPAECYLPEGHAGMHAFHATKPFAPSRPKHSPNCGVTRCAACDREEVGVE